MEKSNSTSIHQFLHHPKEHKSMLNVYRHESKQIISTSNLPPDTQQQQHMLSYWLIMNTTYLHAFRTSEELG